MNTETTVVPLIRPLSPEEFDLERDKILEACGGDSAEARGLRDQKFAALFWRSGWTQEALAEKLGISQQRVTQRLLFGRFLAFTTASSNPSKPPRNLSEWKFRGYWEQTEGSNERARFSEVAKMIEDNTSVRFPHKKRPDLAKAIIEQFADGKWHLSRDIVKATDRPAAEVMSVLESMRVKRSWGCHCERSKLIDTYSYKIITGAGKFIHIGPLRKELKPLLAALRKQGHKEMGVISPGVILGLAGDIERLFEKYGE